VSVMILLIEIKKYLSRKLRLLGDNTCIKLDIDDRSTVVVSLYIL
jgi:hypothetical protein